MERGERLLSSLKCSYVVSDQTDNLELLMHSLPLELVSFIQSLRPLMRTEVFDSFSYLICGILIGEAKYGTVRAKCLCASRLPSSTALGSVLPPQVIASTVHGGSRSTRFGSDLPSRIAKAALLDR